MNDTQLLNKLLSMATVVGAPIAVFAWILFVQFALSWISGWRRLAVSYGITKDVMPAGLTFHRTSGQVGHINYNNVLKLATDAGHLYLVPNFFFALSHPRLRVPLTQVHNAREEKLLFIFKVARFEIDGVKFSLGGSASAALLAAMQNQLQTPETYNPLFVR